MCLGSATAAQEQPAKSKVTNCVVRQEFDGLPQCDFSLVQRVCLFQHKAAEMEPAVGQIRP
jgi:hypothetical protein